MTDELSKTIDDVTFASHFIVNDTNVRNILKSFADTKRLATYQDYVHFRQIQDVFSLINSKPLNNNVRMYLVNRQHFVISSGTEDLTAINGSLDKLMERVDLSKPETLQWLGMAGGDSSGKGKSYYIARVIYDSREKRQVSVLLSAISDSYFNKLLGTIDFGKVALFDANGEFIAGNSGCSRIIRRPGQCPNGQNHIEIELEAGLRGLEKEWSGQISRTFILVLRGSAAVSRVLRNVHPDRQKVAQSDSQTARVVRQFGMGNLDVRLEVKGKDDIAELGQTLNTMLDQLRWLIHDIEQEQEQKRVMELEALFMQIRPHF